jgi:O-antigen ligase
MFVDAPLSGIGWDRVTTYMVAYGGGTKASVHNLLVDAAAQGGIFGLLFGVFLEFGLPITLIRRSKGVPGYYAFAGTCAYMVFCMTLVSPFMLESHWDLFCY